MKAEMLDIFDLNDNKIGEMDRAAFYKDVQQEFEATGKISKQVKSIRLLLLNSSGKIYLQKRNKFKEGNPGLYDKTIGGHLPKGYSWELTVVKECTEELGIPAVVLPVEEFDEATHSVDGAIRFVDGESSGIEVFSKTELVSEIERNPNRFTEDIKFMFKKYSTLIKPVV